MNQRTMHIRNIFKENELDEKTVCKDSLHTVADVGGECKIN